MTRFCFKGIYIWVWEWNWRDDVCAHGGLPD